MQTLESQPCTNEDRRGLISQTQFQKRQSEKLLKQLKYDPAKQQKKSKFKETHLLNEPDVEDEFFSDLIEDARKTKLYFRKMQIVEGGCFVMSLISILVSVVEYDARNIALDTVQSRLYLIMITFATILLIILIIIRYTIELVLLKEQKILSIRDDLISSKRIYSLFFELLIIIPHPNTLTQNVEIISYNLYDDIPVKYQFNDFLEIFLLLRIYILFRVLLNMTQYASARASRICRMIGCEPGYFYAAKCLMFEYPLRTVTILFGISILIGGQGIRICEFPLSKLTPTNPMDFSSYINCFWCMIITMSTVGYGDYYARTIPGRFVSLISCIIGVFLVSIMVVALTNTLNMSDSESKAHNVIGRLVQRKQLSDEAAKIINYQAKKYLIKKHPKKKNKTNLNPFACKSLTTQSEKFKQINRALKNMFDSSTLQEEMSRNFDHLKEDLREIYQNQVDLRDCMINQFSARDLDNIKIQKGLTLKM